MRIVAVALGEGSAKTLEGGVLASATLMRHMARNMARNIEIKATIDSRWRRARLRGFPAAMIGG
ncbi:MAG: hypothetical protein H0T52_08170 [Lautropia sp.]|nr:hypothetical protein [Lautropia sp.]